MTAGFVKIPRAILDDPVIFKDADYVAVWMYLMLNAVFKPVDVNFHGQKTTLQAGQLTTGRKKIAEKCRVSESKVQRILKRFETEHLIEQRTDRQCRLITILSWNRDQQSEQRNEQRLNNGCTTIEQRVNTKKEGKEGKNVNNSSYYGKFGRVLLSDDEYRQLQTEYPNDYERAIELVDQYMERKDKTYTSCTAAIRSWGIGAARKEKAENGKSSNDHRRSCGKRSRMAGAAGRNDGTVKKFDDIGFPMAQDFFS